MIESADLSCIEGLEIRAPIVVLTNVYAKDSVINITSSNVTLNRVTLDGLHIGMFPASVAAAGSAPNPEQLAPLSLRIAVSIARNVHLIGMDGRPSPVDIVGSYFANSSLGMMAAPLSVRFSYFDDVYFALGHPPKGRFAGFRSPRTAEGDFAVDPESTSMCVYAADGSLSSGEACPPDELPILRSLSGYGVFPHAAWFLMKPGSGQENFRFADNRADWDSPAPPESLPIEDVVGIGSRVEVQGRTCPPSSAHAH